MAKRPKWVLHWRGEYVRNDGLAFTSVSEFAMKFDTKKEAQAYADSSISLTAYSPVRVQ